MDRVLPLLLLTFSSCSCSISCCPRLRIHSGAEARRSQALRMGVYRSSLLIVFGQTKSSGWRELTMIILITLLKTPVEEFQK